MYSKAYKMLVTLIVLKIHVVFCAQQQELRPAALRGVLGALKQAVRTDNMQEFKEIFNFETLDNQKKIADNILMLAKQDDEGKNVLKFFVNYWYDSSSGPKTPLGADFAREAYRPLSQLAVRNSELPHDNPGLPYIVQSRITYLLRVWIDAKMDMFRQNAQGKTALHIAVDLDNDEYVNLLVNAGADILMEDADKKSPLQNAIAKQSMPLVQTLCRKLTYHSFGYAMAFAFDSENDDIITEVGRGIHSTLIQSNKEQANLPLTEDEEIAFSEHSKKVKRYVEIWTDLLHNLYVSLKSAIIPLCVDAFWQNVKVNSIAQLYGLVSNSPDALIPARLISDGVRVEISTAFKSKIEMMFEILGGRKLTADKIWGIRILTPNLADGVPMYEVSTGSVIPTREWTSRNLVDAHFSHTVQGTIRCSCSDVTYVPNSGKLAIALLTQSRAQYLAVLTRDVHWSALKIPPRPPPSRRGYVGREERLTVQQIAELNNQGTRQKEDSSSGRQHLAGSSHAGNTRGSAASAQSDVNVVDVDNDSSIAQGHVSNGDTDALLQTSPTRSSGRLRQFLKSPKMLKRKDGKGGTYSETTM